MGFFKRVLLILAAAVLALVLATVGEVVIAVRRDYLPTEPAHEIRGSYGSEDDPVLRFVVLGDSTAAGLGAASPDESYAAALGRMLADSGRRVEMVGFGVSGARTRDVLEEQVDRALEGEPDLIFVGIGANDVTHLTPLSEVRSDMMKIIARLKTTDAAIVVSGVPDMRADAFLQPLRSLAGFRGRQVTGAIEEAAREHGVPMVPLARLTSRYFAEDNLHYSEDVFHPSGAGYRRWAEAIYPYLEAALGESR